MDGYCVEWNSTERNHFTQSPQSIRKETQRNSDSVFSADASAFSATINSESKNIVTESTSNQFKQIVFLNDTLKKKEKIKKKHDAPQKFDEKKDVTKQERKLNVYAVIGFVLSVFAYSLLLFSAELATFIVALIAFVCCFISFIKTKQKNTEASHYSGHNLAIVGLIASGILLALFVIALTNGLFIVI